MPDDFMQILKETFQPKFNRTRFDEDIPLLVLFMAKYKIPWILRWNYELEAKEVFRQRMVKWWDKFDYERVIEVVLRDFPIAQTSAPAVATQTPLKALPKVPDEPDYSQHLSDISPTSSALQGKSSKSKSSSSSRKHDKSKLAQQLMAQAAILMKNEDSDSSSSDASSQPVDPAVNFPPDSQDPYDFS